MEQVIGMLSAKHPNARIFFFGAGERERKCFEEWSKKYPRCVIASSVAKSLQEELVLMSHLDVMLSMDSANTHLASAVDVPVVCVWGATHPYAVLVTENIRQAAEAVRLDTVFFLKGEN